MSSLESAAYSRNFYRHTVDFIDSDIAVLSGFLCRECHFQVDRHLADGIIHVIAPFVE